MFIEGSEDSHFPEDRLDMDRDIEEDMSMVEDEDNSWISRSKRSLDISNNSHMDIVRRATNIRIDLNMEQSGTSGLKEDM